MNTELEEDLRLARRVTLGESDAVNEFYGRHSHPVFAFALHRLNGSRPDAEEIWQDTIIAAIQSLSTYRGECRLSSWVFAIARRKIADRWRRTGRRVQQEIAMPPENLLALMDADVLSADLLSQSAVRAQVVEALADLPHDYRTALIARYAEGESVEDIAERLGRSYKATESLLSRAKAALRDVLAHPMEEAACPPRTLISNRTSTV